MNVNALRGKIAEKGLSQQAVAKNLGMTSKTFYLKMKKGVFGTDEAQRMMEMLDLDTEQAAHIFLS